MARIDDETIRKIRESNDIVDVIGSYLTLEPKGKNYFAICPFHNDTHPSMSVSREKQIFTCFVCGATGNVITFVQKKEKISFVEALELLGKNSGIEINASKRKIETSPYKELYDIYNLATSYYKNNLLTRDGEEARKYLNERNLSKDIIDYFDIGLSLQGGLSQSLTKKFDKNKIIELGLSRDNLKDMFTNRIMFTIKDNYGNAVGFSGRKYKENTDEPKYINSKETVIFKKGKILYNYHRAREHIKDKKEIIINEGFMEVIRLHTIGITNAVALMGTGFTKDHLEIIKNLGVNVVLNLDQDEAGKTATITIGRQLQEEGINVTVIIFKGSKDADEYIVEEGKDAFLKSYENRVSFLDFELDYLKKDKDLSAAEDLTEYINNAIETINKISDDILRDIKIKWLSETYNISEDLIRSKVTKIEIKKPPKENLPPPKKIKYNKYEKSEIRILYLMLNYQEVINYYENNLGYLNDEKRRKLADAIINYKEKNKTFNYADFISYIATNPSLDDVLKEITSYSQLEEYTEEELEDYITRVKEYRVKKQINSLTDKMKNTIDIEEKKKLASRIENIKKEVLKW